METYTESGRETLSFLLDQAVREGEVRIRRENGAVFVLRPEPAQRSALDVEGIDLGITTQEIVELIREGRER